MKKSKWKKFAIGVLLLLIIANILIVISGSTYLYKGLANTYFVGRIGPSIYEKEIFPNRTIECEPASSWRKHEDYNNTELSKEQRDKLKDIRTTAFLVVKNNKLLFEKYWNGHNKEKVSNSFSAAKSIISILIGIAIDEGKINSVNDKVGKYLPYFNEGRKKELTLKHLLTMSSGLNWSESGANPFSDNAKAYYGDDLESLVKDLKVVNEPGEYFHYKSGNTQIAAFILEKATGMNVSEYAEKKLWCKIGAKHEAYWNLDHENGHEKAFCCFYATARDYARIGQLYLNKGEWNGKQVISKKYVNESTTPSGLSNKNFNAKNNYGYFWWIESEKDEKVFYARGILGQYIIVIPDKDLVIFRAGHKRGPRNERNHPIDVYTYIEAAKKLDPNEERH